MNRTEADRWLEGAVKAYGDQLLRLCFLYLHDRHLAEDAVQETFLRAYKAYVRFRGDSSEKTWLTRIAVNVCRDMLRTAWFRRLDRRITPEELALTAPAPEEPALAEAILRLPVRDREVILLRYYEQLTPEAIARVLHTPLNTVKSRLARAKKKLRQTLEGWCDDA